MHFLYDQKFITDIWIREVLKSIPNSSFLRIRSSDVTCLQSRDFLFEIILSFISHWSWEKMSNFSPFKVSCSRVNINISKGKKCKFFRLYAQRALSTKLNFIMPLSSKFDWENEDVGTFQRYHISVYVNWNLDRRF